MFELSRFTFIALGVSLSIGFAQADDIQNPPSLSSKTPYVAKESWQNYQMPPSGYQLVFTELVARHGSRTSTSTGKKDIERLYQIWLSAQENGALTPLGQQLGPQLLALLAAHEKLGYGQLTQRGKVEHQQLAQRLYQRDEALFLQASQQGRKISVWHSGRKRAKDSAKSFVAGLTQAQPALSPLVLPAKTNKAQLYFPQAKENVAYQKYLKHNKQLKNVLHQIIDQPNSHKIAMQTLKLLFSSSFVDRLQNRKYRFKMNGKVIKPDELNTARILYEIYSIAPGMRDEGSWQFTSFMPKESAQWFAYLNDAEEFYKKGPGFKGQNVTYQMAKPLLQDFFSSVQHLSDGATPEVARLRFTHAEIIAPFAALLSYNFV